MSTTASHPLQLRAPRIIGPASGTTRPATRSSPSIQDTSRVAWSGTMGTSPSGTSASFGRSAGARRETPPRCAGAAGMLGRRGLRSGSSSPPCSRSMPLPPSSSASSAAGDARPSCAMSSASVARLWAKAAIEHRPRVSARARGLRRSRSPQLALRATANGAAAAARARGGPRCRTGGEAGGDPEASAAAWSGGASAGSPPPSSSGSEPLRPRSTAAKSWSTTGRPWMTAA
mmetsp:Transcript_18681/g.44629  ORF Transcript_18681/g.44629 Transcript_18681/m.44629 type:complete len:231 (+) Transcript_18681:2391-3083(+)